MKPKVVNCDELPIVRIPQRGEKTSTGDATLRAVRKSHTRIWRPRLGSVSKVGNLKKEKMVLISSLIDYCLIHLTKIVLTSIQQKSVYHTEVDGEVFCKIQAYLRNCILYLPM